jgi:hypothetical protein
MGTVYLSRDVKLLQTGRTERISRMPVQYMGKEFTISIILDWVNSFPAK